MVPAQEFDSALVSEPEVPLAVLEQGEEWRPVEGWPYEVSTLGRVRKVGQPRFIATGKDRFGYLSVTLFHGGAAKTVKVHRLVLSTFIEPRSAPWVSDHINNKPSDNRLVNLRWLTRRQNTLRGIGPTAINARKTHCKYGHLLSDDNVRMRYETVRQCVICLRWRDREVKRKQRGYYAKRTRM